MTKPKLIFFVTKSVWGGAQKYVFDLATDPNYLSNFSIKVAVGGNGDLATKLRESNIEVINLHKLSNTLNPIKLILSTLEVINLLRRERPSIIHTNSSFAGISIGLASFITRTRSIFTIHGWAFNEDRPPSIRAILKIAFWFILLFHNKSIAVSRKIFEQAPNFLNTKKRVKIIHNSVKSIKPAEKMLLPTRKTDDKIRIVTIAEINKNKNHKLVLQALALLPENLADKWEYYIIGDGDKKDDLLEKIKYHKYGTNIFYIGHVDEAARYLSEFDIFVLPSITEAFGYVLLEAGMYKLAIVATSVGGIPEIIEHEQNGFLTEDYNPSQMSLQIQELILNKNRRELFGTNLEKKVSINFSFEKMIVDTISYTLSTLSTK